MYCLKSYLQVLITIALLSPMLSGCMVGPDFHPPHSPAPISYNQKPLPPKTTSIPSLGKAGKAQKFIVAQDIPREWWVLFHSPELNELVSAGITHSPNLAAAYAALRQAQENFNVQVGNSMLPAFNLGFVSERQLFSAAGFGGSLPTNIPIFNLFNANVNVSYTLDIFGGARRQIEALGAQVDFQQFQLIAAYLTLTSNIVTTTITISSLQSQIDTTRNLIRSQEEQLTILRKQFRLGGIGYENVLTQTTLVNQTLATLPPLQKNISKNIHALAALVGAFPNGQIPIINLNTLYLPKHLPVSLPSNLVRQRPDVRASEALLHAASAQIGVATANLLPQVTINGTYGWEGPVLSSLFSPINNYWNITGQVAQALFHGGALVSQRRAAIDAYQQSFAQYRQTVLQAFQNVADSLRAIETDARALRDEREAEIAARDNLKLTTKQFLLGGTNYLSLLIAQQQYHQTALARIQAQADRYTDTAALFQALGGGWWNKPWCVKECLYER